MRKIIVFFLFMVFISTVSVLSYPINVFAFGGGGCGEGECRDCHGMERETAAELLKDLPGVESVDKVDFAQVPGLYAVEITSKSKKHILYIDFSETYVISGNVLHIGRKENVTRKHLMSLKRVE